MTGWERVDFLGAESGIIAGVKNPHWEIQNRAVAQPLVVGRMTTLALICGGGWIVVPVFADTLTLAAGDNWFTSVDWTKIVKQVVSLLFTICSIAALGFAAWWSAHYVKEAVKNMIFDVRQKNEVVKVKSIQNSIVRGDEELESMFRKAKESIQDAGVLAEQRLQMFLTSTHALVDKMKTDLIRMKYQPGIVPRFNDSEWWLWGVITLLLGEFLAECVINIALLGDNVSWLDAGIMAVGFAFLNIFCAFFAGRIVKWIWQRVNHAIACSIGAVIVGIGVYLAAIFGKFRDMFTYGFTLPSGEKIAVGNFQRTTNHLIDEVFPPSFNAFKYDNFDSYTPFVFALLFFSFAMAGAWKIYDPFREMRKLEARLRNIHSRREKTLNDTVTSYKKEARKWPNEIGVGIQRQERDIETGRGQLGQIDRQGANAKAARTVNELLGVAKDKMSELKNKAAELEPDVENAIQLIDAQARQTSAELVKIHKDVVDFTTPRIHNSQTEYFQSNELRRN